MKCNAPIELKRMWTRKAKVVFTRRKTIGEYVYNYSKLCKHYKHNECAKCVCHRYSHLPHVEGHIAFKSTEVIGQGFEPLHSNAKNIVRPSRLDTTLELRTAFYDLHDQLRKALPNHSAPELHLFHDVEEMLPQKRSEERVSTVASCEELKQLRRRFNGLIFSPLDKNAGNTFVCCPCYYERYMRKTYTENESYEHITTQGMKQLH